MCGINVSLGKGGGDTQADQPKKGDKLLVDADDNQAQEEEARDAKREKAGILTMPSGPATKPTGYRTILT